MNGINLHDQTRGWRILREGTSIQGGISKSLNKVVAPGRGGYTPGPSTFTEQVIVFMMRVTRAGLEPLLTLCDAATVLTRTDDSTKEARVELVSAIPTSDTPYDSMFDVTITLNAYDGFWRDSTPVVVGPTSVTGPSQTFTMLSGLSAPILAMDVFLRGVFGQFTLKDAGGSVLKTTRAWPGAAGTGILWMGSSQQAFKANESDPFVPVSDASQYVDVSANGGFMLTPQMVSGNPAVRQVSLQLTTLTQSGVTLRVRARRSYRMN